MNRITLAPTKSDFTKAFNELRKFGYDVKNFNSNLKMKTGIKGFVDHLITGHGHLVFVEVKIGKDTMKPEQLFFAERIKSAVDKNSTVKYWQISNMSECMGIVDYLASHTNG